MSKNLTGKQKKFVSEYLNGCNFNAAAAAKAAGYEASSEHSFEAIGSENLQKPAIKAAIDEYFAGAEVGAEETLRELSKLARGNSKDKIRALALLAQHHGLLDGSWKSRPADGVIKLKVEYETNKKLDEITAELNTQVEQFNREAKESNARKDAAMLELKRLYAHNPEAVQALSHMREIALEYKTIEEVKEELDGKRRKVVPAGQ